MNSINIKKLAKATIANREISKSDADFILDNLSRKNLIAYLRYLKSQNAKNNVKIISDNTLSSIQRKQIQKMFADKKITFEESKSVTGIWAQINDTIIDLRMNGYINQAVSSLEQGL